MRSFKNFLIDILDLRREELPVGGRDLDAVQDAERSRALRLLRMAGIAAGAVVLVAVAGVMFARRSAAPAVIDARIAVIDFENRTENPSLDGLGGVAADWITQRLLQTHALEVVPFTSALAFASATTVAPSVSGFDRAVSIARGVGAGLLVWGSYYVDGDSLRFFAQLIDSRSGSVVRPIATTSTATNDPLAGIAPLRYSVTRAVGRHLNAATGSWSASFADPPAPQAYQHFMRGIAMMVRQDRDAAVQAFAHAFANDTTFVLARLWQARALEECGRLHDADSLVALLSKDRAKLIPYDRSLLDYVNAQAQSRRDDAYAAATAMLWSAPASDDAARLLATSALAMGYPRQARNTLLRLRTDQGWVKSWQGYYASLALTYDMVGDYRDELRVAREGQQQFPASTETWLAMCRASSALKRFADVREFYRLAPRPAPVSVQMPPGSAFFFCAQHLAARANGDGARWYINRAYDWFAAHADTLIPILSRADYAQVLVLRGRNEEGFAYMQQLVRENKDRDVATLLSARLATVAALASRRSEAVAIDAALDTVPEATTAPLILLERARTAAVLGQVERAWSFLGTALQDGLPYATTQTVLPTADLMLQRLRSNPEFKVLFRPRG